MKEFTIAVTCSFGLESVLSRELKYLGYRDLKTENGHIRFKGGPLDIARCNLFLRTADRVLIELADFKADDFDIVFQAVKKIPWEEMLPDDAKVHTFAKSNKSKLFSIPTLQSVTKKAVLEAMRRKYKQDRFPEDGPVFAIETAISNDRVSLTLDTSGDGLHKRGYRKKTVSAPLKETLAAGLVMLSAWKPEFPLIDPLCGSGTILIEAALWAKRIAPGLKRNFAAEEWDFIPQSVWKEARDEAKSQIRDLKLQIEGMDIDKKAILAAKDNAREAGLEKDIFFQEMEFNRVMLKEKKGFLITNPPYGERLGDEEEVKTLSADMGKLYLQNPGWSFYVISGFENFEAQFQRKSNKNRKLYNGNLKCYYYQFDSKW